MNLQSLNIQRKMILIAAAIGIISIFLPWLTISIMGMGDSINGFRGVGIVVFLAFASAAIISLIGDQSQKLDRTMWLAALGAGIIAFLFTIISFGNSSGDAMGFVEAGYGIGIWLSLIASLGVSASAWLNKKPEDNLTNSFEGLKKNAFTSNTSAATNRISELEKLVEMKNQGKISEEEYQQLKSRII